MPLPFKLVSADSHVVEPPDLWKKHIDARFRDRAPGILSNEVTDYFHLDGARKIVGADQGIGLIATKRKYTEPDHDFGGPGRWEEVPEAGWDPLARVKELDAEGIEAELIYTSFGLGMFALEDKDFQFACVRAFNDWLSEFCSASPKRLFGVAMIPTDDIEVGVAEIERCAKMGMRGAMISISQDREHGYDQKIWAPLFSAAEDHALPISLHVAASKTSFHATGNIFADFSCVFTPTMYTIVSMIFSGLFDRHPKLKVISVENDAAWPLAVLERMDDRWEHDQVWARRGNFITSGRKPSEIFHQHAGCTFMRDRTAIVNRDIIGKTNIMWGSDFPHFDGAWPDSAGDLLAQFDGVPLEDQIRIGRTNAIDFYNLPLSHKSEPPQATRSRELAAV